MRLSVCHLNKPNLLCKISWRLRPSRLWLLRALNGYQTSRTQMSVFRLLPMPMWTNVAGRMTHFGALGGLPGVAGGAVVMAVGQ